MLLARAPGKLILSGEHSVVYGAPALALAIDRFSEARIIPHPIIQEFAFHFLDFNHRVVTSFKKLAELMQRLSSKHADFLNDRCDISEILQKPYELAQFVAILILKRLPLAKTLGFELALQSSIPMGCGMGSSAATTLSVMSALCHYFHLPLQPERLLTLARKAEQLQHGLSSGLDLHVSYHGGCIRFQEGQVEKRTLPNWPIYVVNTGTPMSTTGQCVQQAGFHFKKSGLQDRFAEVTTAIDGALTAQHFTETQKAIKENHALLCHIGVVPETVQSFIRDIEAHGAAAKICGAGSVVGENAGSVWVLSETPPVQLAEKYGFTVMEMAANQEGVRVMDNPSPV